MFKLRKAEEGLRTRKSLNKVKKKLNNVQLEGKERIIFIIETLEQELINQGYELEDDMLIPLWKHSGYKIELEISGKRIGGKKVGE